MSLLSHLRSSRVFTGLTDEQSSAVIAAGEVLAFDRGQTIFEQGSLGRDLFVIFEGEVEILITPMVVREGAMVRPRVVARLRPGVSFGEMALLESRPRSASAVSARDGTRVFSIDPEQIERLCRDEPRIGHVVFRNLSASMASLVRDQNTAMLEALMRDYFVHVLAEELAGEVRYCDPSTPIEKTMTIRDPQSFVLSQLLPHPAVEETKKEVCHFLVFAYLPELHEVFGEGEPSGFAVLGQIISLLRDGELLRGVPRDPFEYHFGAGNDRRSGLLACRKQVGGRTKVHFLRWEVKGIEHVDGVSSASIGVHVCVGDAAATERHMAGIVEAIDMPIQRFVSRAIRRDRPIGEGFRVLTVHHRTPEVAYTLRSLADHGFALDAHIGIAYGEASWSRARLLDHASGHAYYCITSTEHPVKPTEYRFDFGQSSFLPAASEAELAALFGQSRGSQPINDYVTAMTRLCAWRLCKALDACEADGKRLLLYEDGGYLVPFVYGVYGDPAHPLHARIKRVVDEGMLVGAVEVTTAGERKNRDVIQQNGGRAILPVLSCASEEIKLVYEGFGVAEAVIDAACTAFGNLGQPTFAARRVAVLGGNGAIGTRLVEQLALAHNSTSNVFVVDIADVPYAREIDRGRYPHAATRLDYRELGRFFVGDRCLPVSYDRPMIGPGAPPDPAAAVRAALEGFFDAPDHDEVAVTNGEGAPEGLIDGIAERASFRRTGDEPLPRGAGRSYLFARGEERKKVTLLGPGVVFSFRTLEGPIRAGVDTVIGTTGFRAFREADFEAFLDREGGPDGGVDTLALLSASSKDYEFKSVLLLIGRLLTLLAEGPTDVDQALAWFSELYRDGRRVVAGDHAEAFTHFLAAPTEEALAASLAAFPVAAAAAGLTAAPEGGLRATLARHLVATLGETLSVRKEVRPDIGLVYHIRYRGRRKALVLLANGFVVNFFARYEKGVKTEYIDPIVTLQMLGLVRLTESAIPPGLHRVSDHLDPVNMARLWDALEVRCRPLDLAAGAAPRRG
jgi:CRP-like cAMP-binding protein